MAPSPSSYASPSPGRRPRPRAYTFAVPFRPSPSASPQSALHDEEHVLDDLPSPPPPSSHPSLDPLDHAEAAVLDTLFSLLLNLSFVLLTAAVVLFVCVFRLPSRSALVNGFNRVVDDWDATYMGELSQAHFQVAGSAEGGWLPMQGVGVGWDALNDEGSDIDTYTPLLFQLNTSIIRPSGRFSGTNGGVTEAALLSVAASGGPWGGMQASAFNVTLGLIKKVNSRNVTQHSCTQYSGVWKPQDHSCDFFVGLRTACLRVLLDAPSKSWRLYDEEAEGGVYTPKPRGNETDDALVVEEGVFGCSYDGAKDDGSAQWDVGAYEPLHEDPYAAKTTLSIIGQREQPKSGGVQRRLLSGPSDPDDSPAFNDSAVNSSSSFSSSSSSSTGAASTAPPAEAKTLEVTLLIRHYKDPFLYAQERTHNTLWFGLARRSILILSFLLFGLAALAMLGKAGTRFDFWCGLMNLKQWLESRRSEWEQSSTAASSALVAMRKKGRGKRRGYTNVGSEDNSQAYGDDEEEEEEVAEVTLETKDGGGAEEEVKMRVTVEGDDGEFAKYELGDLEEEEDEEEQRREEEDGRRGEEEKSGRQEERRVSAVTAAPVRPPEEEQVGDAEG